MTASRSQDNPYVGPRAFQYGETLYGRRQEVQDLLDLLIAERIVLLYSPSGAGKSSLIQAALIPQLEEEGFHILPVMRVNQELPPGLVLPPTFNRYIFSLLLSLEEPLPSEQQTSLDELVTLDLPSYLEKRPTALDEPESSVLIFDQFEEILTIDLADQTAKIEFFAQIGQALRDRQRWGLFALREDYIAGLDAFLRLIPTRLKTTYRLELLREAAAGEAMQEPARRANVDFTTLAVTRLVNDLRRVQVQQPDGSMEERLGPYVEPVQLQVVCRQLWEKLPPEASQITEADIETVGDVDSALAGYYAERVKVIAAETGVSERAIRDWCNNQLITEQGIRGQVLRSAGQSQELDNRAIHALVDAHLVRAEERRGVTWFELAHDRLIKPVQADNAAWRQAHLSALQHQAALWENQGRPGGFLLRDEALIEAERWAEAHSDEVTSIERDFLTACQEARAIVEREQRQASRIRWLAIGATIISLIAIVAFLVALFFFGRAQQQTQIAFSRQLAAQALNLLEDRSDLALLLNLEAYQVANTAEAPSSLLAGIQNGIRAIPSPAFLRSHDKGVLKVAFSPDGQILASASADKTIILWDVATRQPLGQPLIGHKDVVQDVAFSPDGQILASANADQTVILWDLTGSPSPSRIFISHGSEVQSVAFSPDGQTLALVSADKTIILWDLTGSPSPSRAFISHGGEVQSVAFSPDGQTLAAGTEDNMVILWDLTSYPAISQTLTGHKDEVWEVAFSPDGQTLASASSDQTIILWDLTSSPPLSQTLAVHSRPVRGVAFSPDGQTLASASSDQTIILWDLTRSPSLSQTLSSHASAVYSVAFSPDGRTLASASLDKTIILWDLTNSPPLGQTLTGHKNWVWEVALSPDGQTLASASSDQTIILWDLTRSPSLNRTLAGHTGAVYSVAFSPDGQTLASASSDQTIILWDLASSPPFSQTLTGHKHWVWDVAFSPDGRTLASGSRDRTIILWDLTSSPPLSQTLTGHDNSVTGLAFSPNGQLLASGSADPAIILWDLTGNPSRSQTLSGHDETVWSVAFSPDGQTLASGSGDNTIILWDVASRQPLGQPLKGHSKVVFSVAFSPDGQTLASGSRDNNLILWDSSVESWQSHTCNIVGRNLTWTEWNQYLPGQPYRATCPDIALHFFEALRQADTYALAGDTQQASDAFAQTVEATIETNHVELNSCLCQLGSIDGFVDIVLPACERAVELAPHDGQVRDSRGLARALTQDRQGAVEDFKFFMGWLKENENSEQVSREREGWIATLEAGQNPFDATTLDAIRNNAVCESLGTSF